MGGVCSSGIEKENPNNRERSLCNTSKLKTVESFSKQKEDPHGCLSREVGRKTPPRYDSGELQLSISRELKPSVPVKKVAGKVPQMGSLLGRAGIMGLETAVEVFDTLGSSMSNLNTSSGFMSGVASRGNKVSILAFEVANTIGKGANLLQSLSEENIQFLKKEILHSRGVQLLVSTNRRELLQIAASDKREEGDIFSKEVIRFGDLCKDPQWHNLGRYFSKLELDNAIHDQTREEAEMTMHDLSILVEHTCELYHELNALDRFEQDYQRKLDEADSLNLPRKGEGLMMLYSELKQQRKLVRSLKKKSLWSRSLEEIVEKLVDVVTFIHRAIAEAFEDNALAKEEAGNNSHRLGSAGLALHYANIINQIDNIASRPTSLPPNVRDTLYQGLPASVKTALRSRLQTVDSKEQLPMPQVKAEMEKILEWLVPLAANTIKAHQGFGWVGEWANTGNGLVKKMATQTNLIRLQTLFHADQQKMDSYLLELVAWLHRLIGLVRQKDYALNKPLPLRSPSRKGSVVFSNSINYYGAQSNDAQLSQEDRNLLEDVCRRRLVPGISRSQELTEAKRGGGCKVWAFSRSTGSSPVRDRDASPTVVDMEQQQANALDVMDGLDNRII